MTLFQQLRRLKLDHLVEAYITHDVSRRAFLQQALALGLAASSASTLLAACGSKSSEVGERPNSITVLHSWQGNDLAAFEEITAAYTKKYAIQVKLEESDNVENTLTARLQANNPPDLAILPNPRQVQTLASQGKLKALNTLIDMGRLAKEYAPYWINLASYQDNLYGVFFRGTNKGTVWYNPEQFNDNHYQTPLTWDEMITLSNTIADKGTYPWSIGFKDGTNYDWSPSDWIAQIYLSESGPALYDKWIQHTIPWTHSSIKSAFTKSAQIMTSKTYVKDGALQLSSKTVPQSIDSLLSDPAVPCLCYVGDFANELISNQYINALPGTDYNIFPFPTITSGYKGATTASADIVVALQDNDSARDLIQYLAIADSQTLWTTRGGFTSLNMALDLNNYPNEVAKASAQQLAYAPIVRYSALDLMPTAVQTAFTKGVQSFLAEPEQLDTILASIEMAART
jgi:alpha-glucoside transport system substrate-binding protein